jgi:NAD(P)-dependent dehydrogenase (short-subunit alcohol dehydrogenase family)
MPCVFLTGSSSGIGLATALTLGRAGHTVYATMRNPDRAPTLREIIEKEKLAISILTLDVNSDESVAGAVSTVRAQDGSVDVLVNNAGIEHLGSIEELPLEVFRATMETNYFGPLRCIRAWLPEMRRRRSGIIINVTSILGRVTRSPWAPYTASKYALEALSEALAQEVKPFNIRVSIVEPGIIDTPMARRIAAAAPAASSGYPQRRRVARMFAASLEKNPTPPSVVAEKIREIIESETWQLRHLVGPDAKSFLDHRSSMTDEEWVDLIASDDSSRHEG